MDNTERMIQGLLELQTKLGALLLGLKSQPDGENGDAVGAAHTNGFGEAVAAAPVPASEGWGAQDSWTTSLTPPAAGTAWSNSPQGSGSAGWTSPQQTSGSWNLS